MRGALEYVEDADVFLEVRRLVSPADDGTYPVEYRLRSGKWAIKQ